MCGEGKKFSERGYSFPKPLVEIVGKPMIEIVVNNLMPAEVHEFVFVCRQEHLDRFALREVLNLVAPGSKVIGLSTPTSGALCTVLLAISHLENDEELLIVNADQFIDHSVGRFLASARVGNWDGYIMTFPSTHPKWSYAKIEEGVVVEIAEKRPISCNATAGLYYFKKARDFLAAAEKMLIQNAAMEGEYFVAPAYNELILKGGRVGVYPIKQEEMHSLGTPEDVDAFVAYLARDVRKIKP
jgi:NDP-sugar pyrophosphorylase family protein